MTLSLSRYIMTTQHHDGESGMSMRKMDNSGLLPGPKAILISGFSDEDAVRVRHFLAELDEDVPIIRLTPSMLTKRLEQALRITESTEIPLRETDIPRAMIISGISLELLHSILDTLRDSGFNRPMMATSTETSLEFTVKELLLHLMDEMQALKRNQNGG